MVGSGIKKFAKEKGWQIKEGVAFGVYRGYMMSMEEGNGWKSLSVTVRLESDAAMQSAYELLNDKNIKKDYRISNSTVSQSAVTIVFLDNPGTMKRIIEFVERFCDGLDSFGAKGVEYCSSCGLELNGAGVPALMNGAVYMLHEGCLNRDDEQMNYTKEEKQKQGSVATGTLGAFLGAIVGAIPWAVASYFGWFVGWFGFFIGVASKKGYELFKGKETKAKGVAIIISTILCVILAESIAIMVGLGVAWWEQGEVFSILDVVLTYIYALIENSEILTSVLADIALGLVFAALGTWSTISDIFRATSKKADRFIRLDK